jgi:hypothetical protein
MTRTTRQSRILDHRGKPFSFGQLYQTPRSNPKGFRPRPWLSNDTKQNVCEYDRKELVNLSRLAISQIEVLAAAIEQKNNWSFGDAWDAHYTGEDKAWAQEASEFLANQFYPFCNVRGPEYDLRTSLMLYGKALDRDGDDLMILGETENHFPQIAFFPATRVESGSNHANRRGMEVKGGPFDGATIFDGVILNRQNRRIGARLLNDDGTHRDISAFNCDLGFEPAWVDQIRGFPKLSPILRPMANLQDIDGFIQDGIKRSSQYAAVVKNAEGEAPVGNEVITGEDSPTASDPTSDIVGGGHSDRKVHYEEMPGGGGVFLYMDAGAGESVEPFKYENPHPNVEAHIERIQRGCLAAIGWAYELLNLNEGGRAPSRLLCDLANQTITDRQATGRRRWKRIISYGLAKGAKHGFLRKPRDPRDYNRWEPGYPKHLSVDAGNDVKAGIEMCKFGLSTASIEAAKFGYHISTIRKQQEEELNDAASIADRLYARLKGGDRNVTWMDCLQMVRQNNNGNPVQQPQAQEKGAANAD